jgi:DNA-directed RNA polymerase specialized sigma24 family protein
VKGEVGEPNGSEPREFVTTRWSLILSAANLGNEEQKARDALAELCRTYWRPIFSFVRARGYSIEDAQDLTQDFFVTILRNNWLQHADRNRGRFRSFLLRSLQNFLINAAEKTHAHKRGGGTDFATRLRSSSGLRNAIILREIFGSPRSLQPLEDLSRPA